MAYRGGTTTMSLGDGDSRALRPRSCRYHVAGRLFNQAAPFLQVQYVMLFTSRGRRAARIEPNAKTWLAICCH